MPDQEINIEELENSFPLESGTAFMEARAHVLASGLSVLQSEDGGIYQVFPDGHRVLIKEIAPPIPVVAGSKYIIP